MTKEMKEKLIAYIKMQMRLAGFYLQLSNMAKINHLNELSKYLKRLSDDKNTSHIDHVWQYLIDHDEVIDFEGIPCGLKDTVRARMMEVKSIKDLFDLVTFAEGEEVLKRTNEIISLAYSDKDYEVLALMHWYIEDYNTDYLNEWALINDAFTLEYRRDPNAMNLLEIEKIIHRFNKKHFKITCNK